MTVHEVSTSLTNLEAAFANLAEEFKDMRRTINERIPEPLIMDSPFCKGDQNAATYAGFRSRRGFLSFAKANRIRCHRTAGGPKRWKKADILNALTIEADRRTLSNNPSGFPRGKTKPQNPANPIPQHNAGATQK